MDETPWRTWAPVRGVSDTSVRSALSFLYEKGAKDERAISWTPRPPPVQRPDKPLVPVKAVEKKVPVVEVVAEEEVVEEEGGREYEWEEGGDAGAVEENGEGKADDVLAAGVGPGELREDAGATRRTSDASDALLSRPSLLSSSSISPPATRSPTESTATSRSGSTASLHPRPAEPRRAPPEPVPVREDSFEKLFEATRKVGASVALTRARGSAPGVRPGAGRAGRGIRRSMPSVTKKDTTRSMDDLLERRRKKAREGGDQQAAGDEGSAGGSRDLSVDAAVEWAPLGAAVKSEDWTADPVKVFAEKPDPEEVIRSIRASLSSPEEPARASLAGSVEALPNPVLPAAPLGDTRHFLDVVPEIEVPLIEPVKHQEPDLITIAAQILEPEPEPKPEPEPDPPSDPPAIETPEYHIPSPAADTESTSPLSPASSSSLPSPPTPPPPLPAHDSHPIPTTPFYHSHESDPREAHISAMVATPIMALADAEIVDVHPHYEPSRLVAKAAHHAKPVSLPEVVPRRPREPVVLVLRGVAVAEAQTAGGHANVRRKVGERGTGDVLPSITPDTGREVVLVDGSENGRVTAWSQDEDRVGVEPMQVRGGGEGESVRRRAGVRAPSRKTTSRDEPRRGPTPRKGEAPLFPHVEPAVPVSTLPLIEPDPRPSAASTPLPVAPAVPPPATRLQLLPVDATPAHPPLAPAAVPHLLHPYPTRPVKQSTIPTLDLNIATPTERLVWPQEFVSGTLDDTAGHALATLFPPPNAFYHHHTPAPRPRLSHTSPTHAPPKSALKPRISSALTTLPPPSRRPWTVPLLARVPVAVSPARAATAPLVSIVDLNVATVMQECVTFVAVDACEGGGGGLAWVSRLRWMRTLAG
ncbi:hypothetical protein BDK51DRAFT_40721 [Blyttiomyces helicus]|uniref:Uncharacterized protein n=1 Tax=Blyttiomyces helicus TaxID=388810 RepID=A0A4P9W6I7_9FUNG|nr:hypothetical protein BDK51DRAFT_40721 [Blyttiomyces helicus]|eukprot:RKO87934.1 hypothetical protein BDK51DRAFT_40721 [Blyttiomyces helicus]